MELVNKSVIESTSQNYYKKTELGYIPDDWEVGIIKNVAKISTGSKNTQDRVDDGQYPFYVRSFTIERINSYSYDGEAVLVAGDGVGTGKVIHYVNGKFDIHQRVYQIYNFNESIDGYYFFLYFSKNFLARVMSMTAKSSVDSVRREMIAEMPILIAPLTEQRLIATALSETDALISSLEKLIAKKEAIKQGTMQQLFTGRKRLPGFSGEWEVKKLGDIANITMGQSPLSEFYNKNGIGLPLVQGNADIVNRKTIIRSYTSFVTKRGNVGDIVMSVRAPVGEISRATFECCLGRGVCAIFYENEYIYHYLIYFEKSWAKLSTGSTFDSVNSKQVKELEIPIPKSKDTQIAISNILSDMDDEIALLITKLSKYKSIKQGMMQELLTGKTRLV